MQQCPNGIKFAQLPLGLPSVGGNLSDELGFSVVHETHHQQILPVNMSAIELNNLFASCLPKLRRASRLMLRNEQDCEDALQEGLLLAYRKLSQFQGRSSFSTWLHTIVRNAAMAQVRRAKCRPQFASEEEFANAGGPTFQEFSVDSRPDPEERCSQNERSRMLREALQAIPARYRTVVHLCDVDGVDQKKAAKQLGITVCALKTYLFRGRRAAARRMRLRLFHHEYSSLNDDRSCGHQHNAPRFGRPRVAVRRGKLSEGDPCPAHFVAQDAFTLAGGTHEKRRKQSRHWKDSLATSIRATFRNSVHPAG